MLRLLIRLILVLTIGFTMVILAMPRFASRTQVFAYSSEELWVYDARYRLSYRTGIDLSDNRGWSWSPDGTKIAALVNGANQPTLEIIDLPDGNTRQLMVRAGQFPSWSPDGTHIVYSATDAEGVYVVNVADGSWIHRASGVLAREIVWLPDSSGLVITGWSLTQDRSVSPDAYLVKLEDNETEFLFSGVQRTRVSPDGTQLALVSALHNALEVLDINQPENPRELARSNGSVRHLIWSPDNRRIIYEVAFTNLSSLLVVDVFDGLARTFVNDVSEYASYAAWSPDGTQLAFYSQVNSGDIQLTIYDDEATTRDVTVSLAQGFTWSPDSRYLLITTVTGFIIVDATTGTAHNIPVRYDQLPLWQP